MASKVRMVFCILILVLGVLLSASVRADCPGADLNNDCAVDLADLEAFGLQWLDTPGGSANIDGSPGVSFSDFAILAAQWQMQGQRVTLVINEFMADNNGFLFDSAGDDDDWIEIHNYGPEPIDIGGMWIADILTDSNPHRIPTGLAEQTTIPAGGFIILWADSEPFEGPLHLSFKLSADGAEDIALFDGGGRLVDSILNFGPQQENVSYGRLPDAADAWQSFVPGTDAPPTPGQSNGGRLPEDEILITEIMYHPYDAANPLVENVAAEYIEIHNAGLAPVNLEGWQFTNGVSFTFPAVSLAGGEYLVIAADAAVFAGNHPGVANVVGGWQGRLSNSGETIELATAAGKLVDRVSYADEGEWAQRIKGPLDHGHRGWQWSDAHDGGGHSLELVNVNMPNEYGQNWAASSAVGGTPGSANSTAAAQSAPFILDVRHFPIIPRASETVSVSARIVDEAKTPLTATLHYRRDGQPAFTTAAMHDDGSSDDAMPNDGIYGAALPAQPHGAVVEFYISAQDGGALTRTWPAPSDVDGVPQQVTNILYQVDDTFDAAAIWTPGRAPVYYMIVTEAERAELVDIGDSSVDSYPHPIYPNDDEESSSNAQMNATFISIDGVEIQVRYCTGLRNRGNRSRHSPPMNYHVNFRHDDPYNGVTALNINSKYTFNQVLGSLLFRLAGTAAPEAVPVEVRVNGQNLAETGSRMYGLYAALEVYNGDYAENHFPDDPQGNLYRCTYDERWGPRTVANLTYKGTDPAYYIENYVKQTNEPEFDYTDVFDLTYTLNDTAIAEEDYADEVGQVAHLPQWMAFMATDALMGNIEGGLTTGSGDDYAMYRGLFDTRFHLLPHDMDTLFNEGDHGIALDRSIFSFEDTAGLDRLMSNSEAIRMYFRALLDQSSTVMAPETFDPLVQQVLGGWASQSLIDDIKAFMAARRSYVTDPAREIPQDALSVSSNLIVTGGYPHTTNSSFALVGTAPAIETDSILVNGQPADWVLREGTWSYGGAGGSGASEVILPAGSRWRYLDNGTDQGTAWRQADFLDGAWQEGAAELGYGDNDESPDGQVDDGNGAGPYGGRYVTTYFRHAFEIADPSKYAGLELKLLRDDGASVYLNGTEVARNNLPGVLGDDVITYLTRANSAIGGADEEAYYSYYPDPQLLNTGTNVIAVEMHQYSSSSTTAVTSSDLSFNLELIGYEPSEGGEGLLTPGVNRVIVQAMDGKSGLGPEVDRRHIDLWYDDGNMTPATGILQGQPVQSGTLMMTTRDSYLPGVPVLVRVAIVNPDGSINRDVWDAAANLSVTDNAGVTLSTNQITLYNGLGSGLVTFTGTGDFTLSAEVQGLEADRTLVDLTGEPINTVSNGISQSQTWSGIYHITGGDFAIPAGVALTLNPGTLVLIDGVASGTAGLDIDVQGAIQSLGTAEAPVTLTAYAAGQNWGELHFDNAADSAFAFTDITQAGRSPGVGHSGSGPTIRGAGTTLVFDHCNLTDNAGKSMHLTSGCDLTFTNGIMGRCVMGPEIAGTALWCENTWFVDMHANDDADAIYVHDQQAGQQCTMQTGVMANIDDDGLDTLGADIVIEDYIIRNIKDKGISVNVGETTIRRCLVVETNTAPEDPTVSAIAAKVGEGRTAVVYMDRSTVVATRTPGVVDYGIQSHDKYGVTTGTVIWHVANSIIDATDPIAVDDPPYLTSDMHVDYSLANDEVWPGTGNINGDPLFVNAAAHDYRLQGDSACIDAGDPARTDPDGSRLDMGYFSYESASAGQEAILVWTAEEGPYRVSGTATVPAGLTLKIMPGTSVFFDAGASLVVNGRLIAEGAEYRQIRFTRVPGGGAWNGIQFIDTKEDNRIRHAVVEYGVTNDGMIGLTNANVLLEHVTFDHTGRRRLRTQNSSMILRNCIFTDMFGPGEPPLTDNMSEHIWGGGVPADGHYIIENNIFGTTKGHNDAIDIDGFARPNPIPQILNNVFLGGGDDALDIECDIHIEGNLFMHFHKDQYNTASGEGNVMSAGAGKEYTVVRNVFYDVDHVAQVKDGAFMNFLNNTVSKVTVSALYFDLPGRTPGRGAYVDGSIFDDTPLVFDAVVPTTELTVNRSLVNETELALGEANITGPAYLADPAGGDFSLLHRSPAKGAGPHGLDMGADVPLLAIVEGQPRPITHRTDAALHVFGPGVTHYKYRLNDGPWSSEQTIDTPVALAGLANGQTYTLYLLAKNTAGGWQAEEDAAASKTWTIDTAHQTLIINEVLAQARQIESDMIELYYDGPAPLDLEGMSISDNPDNPTKHMFGPGTTMSPDTYLVLHADADNLGFSLDGDGEGVYLYSSAGQLVDSIEFGMQLSDMSVGRLEDGAWALTKPTFGQPNRAAVVGDPHRLKINEWLASGEVLYTDDFIELYNPDDLPVALDGLYITDDPVNGKTKHRFGPLNVVPAKGFVELDADGQDEPRHVNFRLSGKHEILALYSAELIEIDRVVYYGQTVDVSQGRTPDGAAALEFFTTPTPGAANVDTIIINEVLSHSHAAAADWIELHNASAAPVDIGGWFLTDRPEDLMKYEIPAPLLLQPGDYAVFYEDQHFGNAGAPGVHTAFGLSENGESVILSAAAGGVLTGYQREVRFGASATGIAFGRHASSTGAVAFVPMSSNTPSAPNAQPKVGPVVISEIMYNAGSPDAEYIELVNTSASPVILQEYDNVLGHDIPWRLTNGVDYTFPLGTTVAAGERFLVVKDAAVFAARYPNVPAGTKAFAWTSGQLDNNGETVEISQPGDELNGHRFHISVDRVRFDNRAGWPVDTDGTGRSLTRVDTASWGDDCANWMAAQATPGW